ncbi:hypothetical protein KAM339_012970 [Aeromonas caviae]|uniref:hypothetical protein n=1 Tax=Aeromonas caviae TaxID=648 RepID=UPI001CC63D99|nr:hypothetical protein [Aeromonas caviae]BDA12756.1 hypothetical protein KAM339_012970 [Aeromonas caviae]
MGSSTTKIEMLRGGAIVSSVLTTPEQVKLKGNNFQISSKRSMTTFPTLYIKSTDAEINQVIMSFSKGDIIRLSILNDGRGDFDIIFEGEFNKKSMQIEKDSESLTIEVDAIHSFYNLSMVQLSSSFNFSNLTFGKFVADLTLMANIQSSVYITPSLSNTLITGLSYKTNLYRLFKEICLILDATVLFNEDNSVNIDYRSNIIESFRVQKPMTITDNDIISMVSRDSI